MRRPSSSSLHGWFMIRNAPAAAAEVRVQAQTARVESLLRSGTPEGAWDLLSPEARAAGDRTAFVDSIRSAMARLGSLESLGPPRKEGGDWERSGSFLEGDSADSASLAFDSRSSGPGHPSSSRPRPPPGSEFSANWSRSRGTASKERDLPGRRLRMVALQPPARTPSEEREVPDVCALEGSVRGCVLVLPPPRRLRGPLVVQRRRSPPRR